MGGRALQTFWPSFLRSLTSLLELRVLDSDGRARVERAVRSGSRRFAKRRGVGERRRFGQKSDEQRLPSSSLRQVSGLSLLDRKHIVEFEMLIYIIKIIVTYLHV